MKDILDRLKQKVDNKLDWTIKYYAYSAVRYAREKRKNKYAQLCLLQHDITIVAFLEALRTYPGVMPDYSGCVSVELWEVSGKHYVKVLSLSFTMFFRSD